MLVHLRPGRALLPVAALGLLLASSAHAQTRRGRRIQLSLRQAVALALASEPDVIVERLEVGVRDQAVIRERSAYYYPRLGFDIGYLFERLPTPTGSANGIVGHTALTWRLGLESRFPLGTQVGVVVSSARETLDSALTNLSPYYFGRIELRLTQPLLRGAGTEIGNAPITVALKEGEAARAAFQARASAIVLATVDAYWRLVEARLQRGVRQRALELATEHEEVVKKLVRAGARSPLEQLQASSIIAARKLELLAAEQQVVATEAQLLRQLNVQRRLGLEAEIGEIIPTDRPQQAVREPDYASAVKRALARRPEVQQARALSAREQLKAKAARNGLLPKVDLRMRVGGAGFAGGDSTGVCRAYIAQQSGLAPNDPAVLASCPSAPANLIGGYPQSFGNIRDFPFVEVGVNVEIPIGNARARAEAEAASLEERKQRERSFAVARDVALEVRSALELLRRDMERARIAAQGVELAEKNLTAEKKKFAAGASTSFDVLRVQAELTQARSERIRAVISLNVAAARLDQVTASLLERLNVKLK